MSINRIGGGVNPAPTPRVRDQASIEEPAGKTIRPQEDSAGDVAAVRGTTEGVPAKAPPGVDPALWSVLTSAERSFFAKAQPAGPLTYGRTNGDPAPSGVALGGRLDVKA